MAKHYYSTLKSPIGELVITSDGEAITSLMNEEHPLYENAKSGTHKPQLFREAHKQLKEYFKGERMDFDLKLKTEGTEFQNKVWQALRKIQYGKTKSYGELAKSLKNANASRAIGSANSKNPISIIVPCHRVIGSNGKLTGFACGLNAKEWLLKHESLHKA